MMSRIAIWPSSLQSGVPGERKLLLPASLTRVMMSWILTTSWALPLALQLQRRPTAVLRRDSYESKPRVPAAPSRLPRRIDCSAVPELLSPVASAAVWPSTDSEMKPEPAPWPQSISTETQGLAPDWLTDWVLTLSVSVTRPVSSNVTEKRSPVPSVALKPRSMVAVAV